MSHRIRHTFVIPFFVLYELRNTKLFVLLYADFVAPYQPVHPYSLIWSWTVYWLGNELCCSNSRQCSSWSDCVDVQTNLELHCPPNLCLYIMPKVYFFIKCFLIHIFIFHFYLPSTFTHCFTFICWSVHYLFTFIC